ncbi:MAG: hypothetical protein ABSE62_00430 [Chthoniobacteraceae bacterium]|jgi:hypothetical protein
MNWLEQFILRQVANRYAGMLSGGVVKLCLEGLSWTRNLPAPFNQDYDAQTFAKATWIIIRQGVSKLPLSAGTLMKLDSVMVANAPVVPVKKAVAV